MDWNKDKKKAFTVQEAMYQSLDAKNIKLFKAQCTSCLFDGHEWYDTSNAGDGVLLYLRSRGMLAQHPITTYLYRFK